MLFMKSARLALAIIAVWAAARALPQSDKESTILKLDSTLDRVISSNAKLDLVKSGFGFTEGTTWVQEGKSGYLLFSDIPANVIFKLTPDGKASLYLDRTGYRGYDIWNVGFEQTNGKDPKDPQFAKFYMIGSNGLTLDRQGRLLIATWAGRSVVRIEKNGSRTTVADRYDGKSFGGPNDIVVKKDGTIYFSDGYGGLRGGSQNPSSELTPAIYMIKDGKVSIAINDLESPNGLAFSPDEKALYANDTRRRIVRRYNVQPNDTVTGGEIFLDASSDTSPGNVDGMRVDVLGNVYESGPKGIWIVSAAGKHLGTILTPEVVANLEFGGADKRDLYIAARTSIYRVRVLTPGIRASR